MAARFTLHHGDCLKVLKTLPACSVDAIVTDPPAGIGFMSSSGHDWDDPNGGANGVSACLAEILAKVDLPNLNNGDASLGVEFDLPVVAVDASALHFVMGVGRVHARVSVPICSVDFNRDHPAPEVRDTTEAARAIPDGHLPLKNQPEILELDRDAILKFRDEQPRVCRKLPCGCLRDLGAGCFAAPITIVRAASSGRLGTTNFPSLSPLLCDDIGARDIPQHNTEATPRVMTDARTENEAALVLDGAGEPIAVLVANSTPQSQPLNAEACSAAIIGALAAAGCFTPKTKAFRVGEVSLATCRADSIRIRLSCSFHDALNLLVLLNRADKRTIDRTIFVSRMQSIAQECLRVIKPGGHALVWALPRTSHWTGTAWENAGWEVRDVISHIFGTGFPKSLNVSKQIDKAAGATREVVGSSPLTGNGKTMLRSGFHQPDGTGAGDTVKQETFDLTAAATDEAKEWKGFGTALKPAFEGWWLLRKPIEGTVAANVLRHGTGALNIDGCRVGSGEDVVTFDRAPRTTAGSVYDLGTVTGMRQSTQGRWPANVILSKPEDEYALKDGITDEQRKELFKWFYENA